MSGSEVLEGMEKLCRELGCVLNDIDICSVELKRDDKWTLILSDHLDSNKNVELNGIHSIPRNVSESEGEEFSEPIFKDNRTLSFTWRGYTFRQYVDLERYYVSSFLRSRKNGR